MDRQTIDMLRNQTEALVNRVGVSFNRVARVNLVNSNLALNSGWDRQICGGPRFGCERFQVLALILCLVSLVIAGELAWTQEPVKNSAEQDTQAPRKLDWTKLPPAEAGGVWLFHGDSLGPWQVSQQSYFDKHGMVKWENGILSLPAGSPGTGVVATFEVPKNNYELHFQARRTGGDDFFCGLTFPFEDQQGTLILGGWGGGTVGISNVNTYSAIENATTRNVAFEQDRWYKFRLRVTPAEVELWVDDKSLFVLDTEEVKFSIWWEQKPMAPLGFASWRTSAEFKELRLVPVESPKKE